MVIRFDHSYPKPSTGSAFKQLSNFCQERMIPSSLILGSWSLTQIFLASRSSSCPTLVNTQVIAQHEQHHATSHCQWRRWRAMHEGAMCPVSRHPRGSHNYSPKGKGRGSDEKGGSRRKGDHPQQGDCRVKETDCTVAGRAYKAHRKGMYQAKENLNITHALTSTRPGQHWFADISTPEPRHGMKYGSNATWRRT